jgi:tetratricopeptide (TPR) repeat protein
VSRALYRLAGALCLASLCSVSACQKSATESKRPGVAELRERAERDPKHTSRWLLGELLSPDGSPERARQARRSLDRHEAADMLAELGRGIDDQAHGRLRTAPEAFLRAVRAARDSNEPHAELVAWYAASQASSLRSNDPELWKRWKTFVHEALRDPRRLGFRARAELADWSHREAFAEGQRDLPALAARQHGCVEKVRLAGPFGRNSGADLLRSFAAEAPGPWPARFAADPDVGEPPRVLKTERTGCVTRVEDAVGGGIFYAETFVTLPEPREVIVWSPGAIAIRVDDAIALRHDLRRWGTFTRAAAGVRLARGRHRILVQLTDPSAEIRLLHRDGRPLVAATDTDGSRPYALGAPERFEANALAPFVTATGVREPDDDVVRFVAATLAAEDGSADVGSVLAEPLVADLERATGIALSNAARFADADPIFESSQRRDLVRQLNERAAARDPGLWSARLSLALWEAEKGGLPGGARLLKQLTREFPEVPALFASLARLYNELGWYAAYAASAREIAERFAHDSDALEIAIPVLDAAGDSALADKLVERVRELDPDSELVLGRALRREDYALALAELKRIGERRPDRKDITERIYDVMVRAGNEQESWKKLEAAIEQNPKDQYARMALADAGLAAGKTDALVRELVAALEAGAATEVLEAALDLVEGATELEPYRHEALPIIEAYEKSGVALPGTAARVLDYSAVWVHSDGSSRMLDHQIIKVQSAEAITQQAEQQLRGGLWLHLRVIKKNGQILEPEIVEGKPTATLPHLEIGDYVETERIESNSGDGRRGMRYFGPRWYFREENIAYARSEFVVISPKSRPLQIETRNSLPPPQVSEQGSLIVRRWRVDNSPAAPVEPYGAPISEFLPSVQIGWGTSLQSNLRVMSDSVVDLTPNDPRIVRIAERIVDKAKSEDERAKKLYRWVVANVQEGEEDDGRRAVVGKNGNLWRAYITLCRALGIETDYAVAQNRLALPPTGPFSEATLYSQPLLRVGGEDGVWLTLGSKYAPFGYIPAEARGMPAYVLTGAAPRLTQSSSSGGDDALTYEGKLKVAESGAADVALTLRFSGKYATGLRTALSQLPENQIRDVLESRLLGRELRGIQLRSYEVQNFDDLDSPLVIRTQGHLQSFAERTSGGLLLAPPFGPRLSQLAALPARQTPLLLVEATHQRIKLTIELPARAKPEALPAPSVVKNEERVVEVRDALRGSELVLDREVELPAGRVQPNEYARFQEFARQADAVLFRSLRVKLP